MSVPDRCCFQPNFLAKVKIHFHLIDLRCKNTVLEKCILASKENRRISLLTTRASKRGQDCKLVHVSVKEPYTFVEAASQKCRQPAKEEEINNQNQKDWIHFVGVGGCGLSALGLLAVKQVSFCRVLVLTENDINEESFDLLALLFRVLRLVGQI